MPLSREFKFTFVVVLVLGGVLALAIIEMVAPGFFAESRRRGPRTYTIGGRVVCEESGKGCAGAPVILSEGDSERRTHTDAAGWFGFRGHPRRTGRVCAYPDDRPPVDGTLRDIGGRMRPVVLRAPRGRSLRGRVTDVATGKPIVGARLSIERAARLKTTTDEEGRYEIPGVAPSSDLVVEADGYPAHEFSFFEPDGDGLDGNVTLGPGGTIEGRVVDPEGRGIEGVEVALKSPAALFGFTVESDLSTATSGTDGSFRLEGLTKDRHHLLHVPDVAWTTVVTESYVFSGPGARWRPAFAFPGLRIAPVGGTFRDIVVVVHPTGGLRFRVSNPDGKAASYAAIETNTPLVESVHTGRDGTATMTGLGAGPLDVTVRDEGFRDVRIRADVRAGETVEVDVTLDRGASISGRIVGPENLPDWRMTVRAWPADGRRLLPFLDDALRPGLECWARPDGGFHLSGLEPQHDYLVAAWCDEYGASDPVVVRAGASEQILRLMPWSRLRLRLVDAASGELVTAVTMELLPEGDMAPLRSLLRWDRLVVTDDGGIVATRVPAGRYGLRPWSPRLAPVDGAITIPAGAEELDLEVRLDPGAELKGTVRWTEGEPVAGVRVRVLECIHENDLRWAQTDDRGRFSVGGLRHGRHRVFFTGETLESFCAERWTSIDVDAAEEEVVLDLGPKTGGALLVHVTDAGGRFVRGARVSVRDEAGRIVPTGADLTEEELAGFSARTARESFSVQGLWIPQAASVTDWCGTLLRGSLEPGEVRVEVSAEGHETARFTAEIEPRKKTSRTVRLKRR